MPREGQTRELPQGKLSHDSAIITCGVLVLVVVFVMFLLPMFLSKELSGMFEPRFYERELELSEHVVRYTIPNPLGEPSLHTYEYLEAVDLGDDGLYSVYDSFWIRDIEWNWFFVLKSAGLVRVRLQVIRRDPQADVPEQSVAAVLRNQTELRNRRATHRDTRYRTDIKGAVQFSDEGPVWIHFNENSTGVAVSDDESFASALDSDHIFCVHVEVVDKWPGTFDEQDWFPPAMEILNAYLQSIRIESPADVERLPLGVSEESATLIEFPIEGRALERD